MAKQVGENKEQQSVHGVEEIWDNWFNSFKSLQDIQNDIEQKSLAAFAYQKDLLEAAQKSLGDAESESKKMIKEWNEKLEGSFKLAEKNQSELSANWLSTVKEMNEKASELTWNPSHSLVELFSQTQDQLEKSVKEAVKRQEEGRSEALLQIEKLTEQVKKMHKGMLETVSV